MFVTNTGIDRNSSLLEDLECALADKVVFSVNPYGGGFCVL